MSLNGHIGIFLMERLPIKTTPNVRGMDQNFETLEDKTKRTQILGGILHFIL